MRLPVTLLAFKNLKIIHYDSRSMEWFNFSSVHISMVFYVIFEIIFRICQGPKAKFLPLLGYW